MKKTILLVSILILGVNSSVFCETIIKTFQVGNGTTNENSHRREFSIPCGIKPAVSVKYSRIGPAATTNDVPLTIQLMLPPEDGGETGRVVNTKEVMAKTTAQTATLNSDETSSFGCTANWSVRVRATNGSEYAVTGEIRFTTPDTFNLTPVNAGNISLNHEDTTEVDLKTTFAGGIGQGTLEIKGEWYHNLNLLPIKMRFELVNPKGVVVANKEGYPQNELRSSVLGERVVKIVLNYRITEYLSGKWKLRIKNLDDQDDAVRVKPIVTFKSDCP